MSKNYFALYLLSKPQLQPLSWFDVAKILQVFEISKFLLLKNVFNVKFIDYQIFVVLPWLEQRLTEPKSVVLPLHHRTIFQRTILFHCMDDWARSSDFYIPNVAFYRLNYIHIFFSRCKDTNNFWNYQIFS